jgi:Zn-dependent peptidase ImmA (M78 family)/transcriptional regulator with XRE-family HTH domain
VTPLELGQRLREAREASQLTQEYVGKKLGIPRSAVAQMELGNRNVSILELTSLAKLYGRDIREFLEEEDAEDPLIALFRANGDLRNRSEHIQRSRDLGRELTKLEKSVGIDREPTSSVSYRLPHPLNRWEAIRQGSSIADQERRRLGIGYAPIHDIQDLLELQGIRTASIDMPDDISGITIIDPEAGPFVVVNGHQRQVRRFFSFAHECAHVLLDRDKPANVSRKTDDDDLREVRANSFAATLLMPEAGINKFLSSLGNKDNQHPTLDLDTPATRKPAKRDLDLRMHDIVLLAHHFRVSRSAALFRLRNLGLMSDRTFAKLRKEEESGMARKIAQILGAEEDSGDRTKDRFRKRLLGLAMEALRRQAISTNQFQTIASRALGKTPADDVKQLILSLDSPSQTKHR